MAGEHPGVEEAERLEAMVDELATRLAALPEPSFTRRSAADQWTAAEVVGHMTEMMPYWVRVAAAVAAEPGRAFGRPLDDPDRVGAVRAATDLPRAEALARLRHAAHEAATALRALDADAWQRTGTHATQGVMTVGAAIETFLIRHAEAHVAQALTAAGAARD